jgi:thiol-disulfide isomerase/thioredoxin
MNTPGLRFFGAALVALLGLWTGLKMHAGPSTRPVAVPAGISSPPSIEDSSAASVAGPRAVIPERLPEFALQDLSGKATAISAWSGQSLVINFWATWCPPCRREIPLLEALSTEWAQRDLKIIGIAVDHRDKVQEFVGQFKIQYPVLVGEQDALDVAAKFGMDSPAFPFTVFTDRRGEVVALFVGEMQRPEADLILSEVQNLNRDLVQLPEARRVIADGLRKLTEKRAG